MVSQNAGGESPPATLPSIRSANWRSLLISCCLAALTLFAFWPVRLNEFLKYDDNWYVTGNPHVLGGLTWQNALWAFHSGYAANWHPLTWLSHMLDITLFGLNPAEHHLTNLFLHTANSLLLFWLLRLWTASEWRSAMVAALFALHPLHVESVAWVAERKDVLSTLFFLLTLSAYTRYARAANSPAPLTFRVPRSYFLSLVLFALGLMSKPMLVTVPFVLLLLDYWPLRRFTPPILERSQAPLRHPGSPPTLALVLEKVPFLCLAALSSAVTLVAQTCWGAMTSADRVSLGDRWINAIASCCKYLEKTFWPLDLAVFYPHPALHHPAPNQWPLWQVAIAGLLLLAISAAAFLCRRRQPWFVTGWFWYLGTLVPVIGIIQVGDQAMADRYTYVPLIGIFICLVWGAALAFANAPFAKPVLAALAAVTLAACLGLTRAQLRCWRTNLALFEHALAATTDNPQAHYQVGTELRQQGNYGQALEHFRAALTADPGLADAWYGQAFTLELLGNQGDAIENYQAALRAKPTHAPAHYRLGRLLERQGRWQEAMEHYLETIRLNPEMAEAYYNLGQVLSAHGDPVAGAARFAQAETRFRQSVRLNPGDAEARINLGGVLWRLGRLDEAAQEYREALRLKPDDETAHHNLALLLAAQSRLDEASVHWAEVVRLKPHSFDALNGLGQSLAAQRKFEEALVPFRQVVELHPTNAIAWLNLGSALMMAGHTNEGAASFARALRCDPELAQKNIDAGKTLLAQGYSAEAVARFKAALWLKPNDVSALNDLAWVLATDPHGDIRNASEAVRLAERACSLTDGPETLLRGILDTAYAAAGRFDDARTAAEKARALALASGNEAAVQAADARLAAYRNQTMRPQ